jgi:superfamily I DNA/RNA helicase
VEKLKKLFVDYVESKQRQSVLDYYDLLLYWAQMMSDSGLASVIGSRFDQVLVDEYQDTNRLQARGSSRVAGRVRMGPPLVRVPSRSHPR